MPRRSFVKIQANRDLSHYFIPMEFEFMRQVDPEAAELAQPSDGADKVKRVLYADLANLTREELSERLFGRVAPLELEIGSGKGQFICDATKAFPERNFLGVEIAYRYALISASKLAKQQTPNGVMLAADAARALREIIPDASLDAAHIYFPDPWWKKAHRKRRIVRPDVVRTIEKKLVPGGKLHFWTDVREYFLSGVETIKLSTNLYGPFSVVETECVNALHYRTHFERRASLSDTPIHRAYFQKEF